MKKQLFNALLCGLLAIPFMPTKAQSTVDAGQSTEGKDFWVTFMQADQNTSDDGDWDGNYNTLTLSLSISSRENCQVTIANPFTKYSETFDVVANEMKLVEVYKGSPLTTAARNAMTTSKKVCYAVNNEQVDTCALHVTATANIALFATNYKKATFDATNVLPTTSLLNEYYIQTYTPYDHGGTAQGSHFAVVAVENNTKVWYTPSVLIGKNRTGYQEYLDNKDKEYTENPFYTPEQNAAAKKEFDDKKAALIAQWGDFVIGEHTDTVVLQKGQVYYVWTGKGTGDDYDLSGTYVKADKKIAVFQGNPHTNVPKDIKDRDHVFSQAMPTQYWGNTFVVTGSKSRGRDFVRVMALNDQTTIYINGDSIYTFDFKKNPKHYWEFEYGDKVVKGGDTDKDDKLITRPEPTVEGNNYILTTSCPCAVHIFTASRMWDGNKKHWGDPSMIWINPIEQQIDQVTFATYKSLNTKYETNHYVNIVTDKPESIELDNKSIKDSFQLVTKSDTYYYAQVALGQNATSHTLKSIDGKFIAHVYGFTGNESYGYSAGGATKPLTQYVTINGEIFTPESDNTLCGEDTIKFACHPDYVYTKMEWNFGDGKDTVIPYGGDTLVPHYYEKSGTYPAFVKIFRESSNLCAGQNAVDSIPIRVTIGRYQFSIGTPDIPCPEGGKQYVGRIPYTNEGKVDLKGDNVTIKFNDAATQDGFADSLLVINEDYFEITIPNTAKPETQYGIDLKITSNCGGADTTLYFMLNFDNDVIDQRYNNVLGLLTTPFAGKELSDFQWYRTSDSTAVEGQVTSNLNFYDLPSGEYEGDAYYVCFTINKGQASETKTCACAKAFSKNTQQQNFAPDSTGLKIEATYSAIVSGGSVFVNADYKGQTGIECYAQWIDASGHIYNPQPYTIPDGGCIIPAPKVSSPTLYLLRVVTGKGSRSFKFLIQ